MLLQKNHLLTLIMLWLGSLLFLSLPAAITCPDAEAVTTLFSITSLEPSVGQGLTSGGAHKSADKKKSLTVLHEFISDFKISILDLTQEIMNAYAKTKVLLEEKGKKLDEFDLLIGATAIVHSLPFVTLNLSHFERIPNLHIVKNHS